MQLCFGTITREGRGVGNGVAERSVVAGVVDWLDDGVGIVGFESNCAVKRVADAVVGTNVDDGPMSRCSETVAECRWYFRFPRKELIVVG